MTTTSVMPNFQEWLKNNPPKCKCCEVLLDMSLKGFIERSHRKLIDVDGERHKGMYCFKCFDEAEAYLMNSRFVEVYENNTIYCKDGKYLPYWGSAWYFDSLKDVKLWIRHRLNQMKKARETWQYQ